MNSTHLTFETPLPSHVNSVLALAAGSSRGRSRKTEAPLAVACQDITADLNRLEFEAVEVQ